MSTENNMQMVWEKLSERKYFLMVVNEGVQVDATVKPDVTFKSMMVDYRVDYKFVNGKSIFTNSLQEIREAKKQVEDAVMELALEVSMMKERKNVFEEAIQV